MTSPPPISENLTLFETSKLLLAELQTTNRLLVQQLQGQATLHDSLRELGYLLNGFTSGGASFSAYQSDTMTQAYLAVMGPLLGAKLAAQDLELPEMMKGATLLARQLIEELSAYRSERGSLDYLEEQTELIHDPWNHASEEPAEA
jgi:hypothetical protein